MVLVHKLTFYLGKYHRFEKAGLLNQLLCIVVCTADQSYSGLFTMELDHMKSLRLELWFLVQQSAKAYQKTVSLKGFHPSVL